MVNQNPNACGLLKSAERALRLNKKDWLRQAIYCFCFLSAAA